jgi:hypothetical protein
MQRKGQGTPKQSYSIEDCRKALAEMVIIDEMPFNLLKVKDLEGIPKCYSRGLTHLQE